MKEKVSRDEQIALSIMAYLETHIKRDKGLVLRGVTLHDAREWIRRQIAKEQPVSEDLQIEQERYWEANELVVGEDIDYDKFCRIARHFAQWGAEHLKK